MITYSPAPTTPLDVLIDALLDSVRSASAEELRRDAEHVGENMSEVAVELRAACARAMAAAGSPGPDLGSAKTLLPEEHDEASRSVTGGRVTGPLHLTRYAGENTDGSKSGPPVTIPDERAAARDPHALPRKIGRYAILRRLGSGGMGEVYAAYDESLHRKIAIKVLRLRHAGRETARLRLIREAQAMARVVHPNVATVYEVNSERDQVYVSMEYIEGATLSEWLRASARTPQEIIRVFVQAARGLAAVHRAGLVHRDFKPANVMIDDRGRAHVLDFGLAGLVDAPPLDETSADGDAPADPLSSRITTIGAVIGTPVYMSPEQFRGDPPRAATDQFSFCVALFEALYGARPFAGDTYRDLIANVLVGKMTQVPARPRGLPRRVHAAVMRGLSLEAEARFPTMEALISRINFDPSRARRQWGVGVALAGVAASGGYAAVAMNSAAAVTPCSGVDAEREGAWSETRRDGVARALAVAGGERFADELAPRVFSRLDRYAARWVEARQESCWAHHRGEQSDAQYDRHAACLERRLASLQGAADVLEDASAAVALKAVDIADQLPSIATCESAEYVNAVFAPPSTPEAAAEIEGLRQQLTRAATLETAGELPRARALASEVALRASELSYRPLEAQARLLDGRAQMELGEARPADTAALLNQALAAATAADLPDIAAESLARGLFVQALDGHADDALRWATVAEAHLERAVERDRLRGLLRNNLGAIYRMRGDDERARELFEEALTARVAAHGAQHVEVARTLINLSLVSESDGARVDAMRRALEIFEAQLGPSHPETLDKRIGLSVHLSSPSEAAELLERACAQFSHEHPDSTEIRQRCLIFLAHHRAETGDTARAAGTLRTALQLTAARADAAPIDALGRATVEALASYYEGDYAAGVAAIEGPLRDAGEADAPWWIERRLGEAAYALGLNLLALDRRDEAVGPLERAVAAMSRAREAAPRVEYYQREANAQWALAQALGRSPETRARADELAAAAARWYERAGPEYASRLAAVRSRRE